MQNVTHGNTPCLPRQDFNPLSITVGGAIGFISIVGVKRIKVERQIYKKIGQQMYSTKNKKSIIIELAKVTIF